MAMVNPYSSSDVPVTPNTRHPKRSVQRTILNVAIALSGLAVLVVREFMERALYWGKLSPTDGTDRELLLHAFVTNPIWTNCSTQTAVVVLPTFVLFLLWARRNFA